MFPAKSIIDLRQIKKNTRKRCEERNKDSQFAGQDQLGRLDWWARTKLMALKGIKTGHLLLMLGKRQVSNWAGFWKWTGLLWRQRRTQCLYSCSKMIQRQSGQDDAHDAMQNGWRRTSNGPKSKQESTMKSPGGQSTSEEGPVTVEVTRT